MHPENFKNGYVALIGKPNVGKSTLLNALMGQKLSIVTPKAQTTRHRVLGILTEESTQIIFLDTPGIMRPNTSLDQAMMRKVRDSVADADLIIFIVDARADEPDSQGLKTILDRPAILALNKTDLVKQDQLLPLVDAYTNLHPFKAIVPISALKETNLDALMGEIRNCLPSGPALYPAEMISEHPERFFVAEIIREKVFEQFRQEIPYSSTVVISNFVERDQAKDLIEADIIVERPSQKGILIGAKARALKAIGIKARQDIEQFLEREVYLKLFVRVRKDWRNQGQLLRSFGYR
ncbi:MAG: GTPase Era [Rhodothermaceae bacterium]|nr:GTPase Era [Bacteroidota bacterium]MXX96445.1 GTPase Era [Rhodothermaceae bacterium]MXZ59117.1 GTPase Era [Rhodothermaceae bacterium]MYB90304.1 GTPase Era [Rhodothermaceae bacterium]MYD68520.1 GTPase Era [Rhodothermaceae bacterium]